MTIPTHGGRAVEAEPTGEARTTAPPPHHPRRGVRRRADLAPRRPAAQLPVRLLAALLVLATLALAAAACGAASGSSASSGGEPREISVFAASSLTDAFTRLGEDFTAAHPGVTVTFNFAGSNDLVTQLQQGAPADVLATADTRSMEAAGDLAGAPQAFAGNKLVIAVAPGNPEHITGLADLAREDLKVVLAAPEVPAGKYAEEVLAEAGVTVKPVSLEVSVKGVVTKVSLGEADAGIVYATDVDAAQGKLEGVAIPDDRQRDRHLPHRGAGRERAPRGRAGLRRPRPLRRGPEGPRRLRVPAGSVKSRRTKGRGTGGAPLCDGGDNSARADAREKEPTGSLAVVAGDAIAPPQRPEPAPWWAPATDIRRVVRPGGDRAPLGFVPARRGRGRVPRPCR